MESRTNISGLGIVGQSNVPFHAIFGKIYLSFLHLIAPIEMLYASKANILKSKSKNHQSFIEKCVPIQIECSICTLYVYERTYQHVHL